MHTPLLLKGTGAGTGDEHSMMTALARLVDALHDFSKQLREQDRSQHIKGHLKKKSSLLPSSLLQVSQPLALKPVRLYS